MNFIEYLTLSRDEDKLTPEDKKKLNELREIIQERAKEIEDESTEKNVAELREEIDRYRK